MISLHIEKADEKHKRNEGGEWWSECWSDGVVMKWCHHTPCFLVLLDFLVTTRTMTQGTRHAGRRTLDTQGRRCAGTQVRRDAWTQGGRAATGIRSIHLYFASLSSTLFTTQSTEQDTKRSTCFHIILHDGSCEHEPMWYCSNTVCGGCEHAFILYLPSCSSWLGLLWYYKTFTVSIVHFTSGISLTLKSVIWQFHTVISFKNINQREAHPVPPETVQDHILQNTQNCIYYSWKYLMYWILFLVLFDVEKVSSSGLGPIMAGDLTLFLLTFSLLVMLIET